MDKTKPVCSTCKSDNVFVDAYVSWDVATETWQVENTFPKGGHCNDCGGECTITWEKI